jgi:hypothetical protein
LRNDQVDDIFRLQAQIVKSFREFLTKERFAAINSKFGEMLKRFGLAVHLSFVDAIKVSLRTFERQV